MNKFFKALLFISSVMIIIAISGCNKMTNEYTGKTYHSVSEIAEEARVKLEKKYGLEEYDLTVLESTTDDSGGFFGIPKGVPVVKILLKDKEGKQFTAYYAAGKENPMVFDDYQYDEILADFMALYQEKIEGAEKVVIQYNVLSHDRVNLLSETEVYTGDLSLIDLTGVRVEYINEDISDREFNEVKNYLFISFESEEKMVEVEKRMKNDWFKAPLVSVLGVQAVKDDERYISYESLQYKDYYFISPSKMTVEEPEEAFDITCLKGNGSIDPEALLDPVTITYDEDYSIYIKASVVLEKLVELGFTKYDIDPDTVEGERFMNENEIPVRIGYKYWYNDGYSYHASQLRYENGYFVAGNIKPKYDTICIFVDQEFLKK